MKVSQLLDTRRGQWLELERLCQQLEERTQRSVGGAKIARFASLYRSACADLALAESYQLPDNAVQYLHQLVGRAHNQLYRTRKFHFSRWGHELLFELPRRLYRDNSLRLAFVLFWGTFLAAALMSAQSRNFTEQILGKDQITQLQSMYSEPLAGRPSSERAAMVGFYVYNNAGIGLRCFAYGVLFGVGGMFMTLSNALILGASFGHMATVPEGRNFYQFVTAHGPFELTAIVLSAAAGMRLGFSLIHTRGLGRRESLNRTGAEVMPTVGLAILLFGLAALIEGFLSPSGAPYWVKASVAVASSGLMLFYFVMLGRPIETDAYDDVEPFATVEAGETVDAI